jgi:general secretion pathway protein D
MRGAFVVVGLAFLVHGGSRLAGQDTASVRLKDDSVHIRFVETDLRAAIRSVGTLLDRPIVVGELPPLKLSFETPVPIPRSRVASLLRALVESQGLELLTDSLMYRVAPRAGDRRLQAAVQDGGPGVPELHVIRLRHARAADVAATVNLLFGGGGEFSGRGLSGGTLTEELRRSAGPPPATPEQAQPATAKPHVAILAGPVTLVPDELTNSLLIRASAADVDLIRAAVEQLDVRPLQVLIEVLIVEARRDRTFSLGVSLDYAKPDGKNRYEGGIGSVGPGDAVLKFMRLARSEVTAVLSAAQSRGDVEIVSRPVLLASNNTEAHFLVGSQRPFVQVSRSLPTDVPSRDQVVQYRDVGTKLTVRPTINQDGYVSLVIQQEISGATDESQFGAPIISTREARTQVLVRDSQTIVLGGLKDQQRDRNRSGVPVLSGIPVIGGLFGSTRRRNSATELYLFLTPRIIRTDADVDSVTAPRLPPAERPQ